MKTTSIHFSLLIVSASLVQSLSGSAWGGAISGKADPGSKVSVTAYDKNGNVVTPPNSPNEQTATMTASPTTGAFNYGFGDAATEKMINYYIVTRNVGGTPMTSSVKQGASLSLNSNEPFDVPVFAAIHPVVATIDMSMLLSTGDPLTSGENLSVTNGSIPESAAIIFRDSSALPTSGTITQAEIDALPVYTGSISVFSFDHVQAVPEPSSLVLGLIAVTGIVLVKCHHRMK